MIHRDFEDAEASAGGFHLHLQVPAVGLFAHIKCRKRITSNSTERAHICVTNAVESLHYPSGNSTGQNLLEIHAAGLAVPARAGADHEIMRSARDRLH